MGTKLTIGFSFWQTKGIMRFGGWGLKWEFRVVVKWVFLTTGTIYSGSNQLFTTVNLWSKVGLLSQVQFLIFSSKDIDLELILIPMVCIIWKIRTDELMDSLFMLLEYHESSSKCGKPDSPLLQIFIDFKILVTSSACLTWNLLPDHSNASQGGGSLLSPCNFFPL